MSAAYLESALKSGRLDAAWEPAPLDAQITAAGGRVLVNEASLWPRGRLGVSWAIRVDTVKTQSERSRCR